MLFCIKCLFASNALLPQMPFRVKCSRKMLAYAFLTTLMATHSLRLMKHSFHLITLSRLRIYLLPLSTKRCFIKGIYETITSQKERERERERKWKEKIFIFIVICAICHAKSLSAIHSNASKCVISTLYSLHLQKKKIFTNHKIQWQEAAMCEEIEEEIFLLLLSLYVCFIFFFFSVQFH